MNVFQKAAAGSTSDHVKAAPRLIAEPFHATGKDSFEAIMGRLERVPFSTGDGARMLAHFQKSAKNGYDYDIKPSTEGPATAAAQRDGVVKLSSTNFGYEFTLVNVDAGQGFFGAQRSAVRIYVSNLNSDDYSHVKTVSSLSSALSAIDKMYCEAAALHLP
jgi:hypothetical protein